MPPCGYLLSLLKKTSYIFAMFLLSLDSGQRRGIQVERLSRLCSMLCPDLYSLSRYRLRIVCDGSSKLPPCGRKQKGGQGSLPKGQLSLGLVWFRPRQLDQGAAARRKGDRPLGIKLPPGSVPKQLAACIQQACLKQTNDRGRNRTVLWCAHNLMHDVQS